MTRRSNDCTCESHQSSYEINHRCDRYSMPSLLMPLPTCILPSSKLALIKSLRLIARRHKIKSQYTPTPLPGREDHVLWWILSSAFTYTPRASQRSITTSLLTIASTSRFPPRPWQTRAALTQAQTATTHAAAEATQSLVRSVQPSELPTVRGRQHMLMALQTTIHAA